MNLESLYSFASALWVVWFMTLFVGIVTWAYWPARRGQFEEQARIPLKDDR